MSTLFSFFHFFFPLFPFFLHSLPSFFPSSTMSTLFSLFHVFPFFLHSLPSFLLSFLPSFTMSTFFFFFHFFFPSFLTPLSLQFLPSSFASFLFLPIIFKACKACCSGHIYWNRQQHVCCALVCDGAVMFTVVYF